jgi:hypothetical protein
VKGYASPNADRRDAALARKRQEYMDCVPQYYDIPDADRTEDEIVMLHQVLPTFSRLYTWLTFQIILCLFTRFKFFLLEYS